MVRKYIIFNNYFVIKCLFIVVVQYQITYYTDSMIHIYKCVPINCTKVTFSLMSFRISKAPLFFHFFRLYLRYCSPLWRNLFFIISLAESTLFLNLFVSNVNNYSMQFARVVTAMLSPILKKLMLNSSNNNY